MGRGARIVALILVAFVVVVPTSAHAGSPVKSVGSFAYVNASDGIDPMDDATTRADCPANFDALGGGGSVQSINGQERIFGGEVPLAAQDSYDLSAVNAAPSLVSMVSTVICVEDALVNGKMQYRGGTDTAWNDATTLRTDETPCNDGSHLVVGGGAAVGTPLAHLESSYPDPPFFYRFRASKSSLTSTVTRLESVCLLDDSTFEMFNVTKLLPAEGGHSHQVSVKCPKNAHVVSGGWIYDNTDASIVTSAPLDGKDKDRAPDDGWKIKATGPLSDDLTVAAVCLK